MVDIKKIKFVRESIFSSFVENFVLKRKTKGSKNRQVQLIDDKDRIVDLLLIESLSAGYIVFRI